MNIQENQRVLLQKATQHFNSPFFCYDLDTLDAQIRDMKSKFDSESVRIWYSCKANPLSNVISKFVEHGFGMDVSSDGELDQVLRSGCKPENILLEGPGKSKKHLENAVSRGVEFVVLESTNQALWLNEIAKAQNKKIKVLLRFQLPAMDSRNTHEDITAFGIYPQDWIDFNIKKCDALDVQGVHIFQWNNVLDLYRLRGIWYQALLSTREICAQAKIPMNIVDLGGGIGIPYKLKEKPLNISDINRTLLDIKRDFEIKNIWLKLGRYSVGEHGFYATRVIDRKSVMGKEILVMEGGINHVSRVAMGKQTYPCELLRHSQSPMKEFQLHGPLCTARDRFGVFNLPEDINVDDWLVFGHIGAYGFTECMPYFLCNNLPGESVIQNGDLKIVREVTSSLSWRV